MQNHSGLWIGLRFCLRPGKNEYVNIGVKPGARQALRNEENPPSRIWMFRLGVCRLDCSFLCDMCPKGMQVNWLMCKTDTYVYIYTYMYVYIYISICICICMYIYTHIHIHTYSVYFVAQVFYLRVTICT